MSNHVLTDDLLDDWRGDVLHGKPPKRYSMGDGLDSISLGPGMVALIGGAPGMGKTAFAMQCVADAMVADESLTACVCNVEMPVERLLERQLSRLSDIPLSDILHRRLNDKQRDALEPAFEVIESIADRLVWVKSSYTLEAVAEAADSIDAELIILDYIQRIRSTSSKGEDKKSTVDATMDSLRRFADAGCCVLALSAVGRSKDKRGRQSYAGEDLSLASFRESSELEFGADDAFLLVAGAPDASPTDAVAEVTLKQLKSRYGQPTDVELLFDRTVQSFRVEGGRLADAIAEAWKP
ncbi:MAG: DnaB-like helicase C-terminal domain-containing protein [Aureliella sp.]